MRTLSRLVICLACGIPSCVIFIWCSGGAGAQPSTPVGGAPVLYYEVLELPLQQVENLKEITVCPPTPRPRPLPPGSVRECVPRALVTAGP